MASTPDLPDERDPRGPMAISSKTSQRNLVGAEAGFVAPANGGPFPDLLPQHLVYSSEAKRYGMAMGGAALAAYNQDAPATRVGSTNELPLAVDTPTETGMEHRFTWANQATVRRTGRGPFTESPPSQRSIKSNLASKPAAPFDSSDEAVMGLLLDF